METSKLTQKARGIASCLTYNNGEHEAAAKHMLHEMSHRLDTLDIRAHNKKDGLLFIDGIGKCRYATFTEVWLYKLFGVLPREI